MFFHIFAIDNEKLFATLRGAKVNSTRCALGTTHSIAEAWIGRSNTSVNYNLPFSY